MTICKNQNKMEKRLRLRDWLELRISNPLYPGLVWVNKEDKIFRIPWKHGGRHGWKEEDDARLFREWSEHTGASPRDVKQHKANFRCALNSLRDVSQMRTLNKQKGDDAYRVYRMEPKKRGGKERNVWIKKRKQPLTSSKDSIDPISSRNHISPNTIPNPTSSANTFNPHNEESPSHYESTGPSPYSEWNSPSLRSCCRENETFMPNKSYASPAPHRQPQSYPDYQTHTLLSHFSHTQTDGIPSYAMHPHLSPDSINPHPPYSSSCFQPDPSFFSRISSYPVINEGEFSKRIPGPSFAQDVASDSPYNKNFFSFENSFSSSENLFYGNNLYSPETCTGHAEEIVNFSHIEMQCEKMKMFTTSEASLEEQDCGHLKVVSTSWTPNSKSPSTDYDAGPSGIGPNPWSKEICTIQESISCEEPTREFSDYGFEEKSPNLCDLSTSKFSPDTLHSLQDEQKICALPSAETLLTPIHNKVSDTSFPLNPLMIHGY